MYAQGVGFLVVFQARPRNTPRPRDRRRTYRHIWTTERAAVGVPLVSHADENGGVARIVIGVALLIGGTIWILQGLDVAFAPESFMTGNRFWSGTGIGAVVAGAGLVWWGVRSRRYDE